MFAALPGFLFWWIVIDIVCIAVFDIACVAGRDDTWRKAEDDEQAAHFNPQHK